MFLISNGRCLCIFLRCKNRAFLLVHCVILADTDNPPHSYVVRFEMVMVVCLWIKEIDSKINREAGVIF